MPYDRDQLTRSTWRNVLPVEAPGCSQGTPYSFWVKEGQLTKIAIILAGGGACWTGENAALYGKPFYQPFAGLSGDPSDFGGIFATENPANPLADYTLIYLPTANGDVFLGHSVTTYDVPEINGHPAAKVKILHKGYDNASSVLRWVFRTFTKPTDVVVAGWSAGAIASLLYTHIVASHYKGAAVRHFADGGGAYRVGDKLAPLVQSWGTAKVLQRVVGFQDLDIDKLSLEDLYIRAAELHPEITFHQYNEKDDQIQALFMRLMGVTAPDVLANLDDAHTHIRARIPNFRIYTSWGNDEGIIGGYYDAVLAKNALDNRGRPHVLDRFYTRQVNGIRFLDWFTDAITGRHVQDVVCVDRRTPEYHWTRPKFPQV
ncbi:Hypothetical protein D9617_31g064250 [Elsinoe fawcettii]|nr:Hypothetical protein D9617_31g064250 [Elsinoe fawcettii]